MEASYIAVDLETTGLDPKRDKIIEIGAIKVKEGQVQDTFEAMVNPYRSLEERIVTLTGIKNEELEKASGVEEVLSRFLDFAEELPLLGHHVIFDYSFLKRAAVNQKRSFERKGIDTLKLVRSFMPEEEKKNLEAACSYYGVKLENHHRAMADAEAAHALYQELVKRYEKERPEVFLPQPLIYKVKREQPASKRQKEHLQDLVKYHKISLTVQIDHLSRNEISRITDRIIAQYGRIIER